MRVPNVVSVSYTHLLALVDALVLALVDALVLADVLALVEALVPVSYTHLDVYKRQATYAS